MGENSQIQRWWDGLDTEERARALRAHDEGRATGPLLASLRKAGVIGKKEPDDTTIPDDVDIFLKARH